MRLVTIKEASKILGVSRETIKRYINSGELSAIHIGTGTERESLRIDLVRFLTRNGIDPAPYLNGDKFGLLSDKKEESDGAQ
jgi:excisionase family DNA binding protein